MKILFPVALLLFVGLACSNPTKVNPGSTIPAGTVAEGIRRTTVNQTKEFNGLSVTIGEIALEKGKITVGITLNNKTKDTITTFPDQGEIVIGSTQLDADIFTSEGNLGGEIHAGVEKRGSIAFTDTANTLDMASVRKMDLRLGTVFGPSFSKSTAIIFPIEIH